jgi:release factor glutamine methyltransferase
MDEQRSGHAMTVARALGLAARRLRTSSPSPRLDVEILLAHVLGVRRERLYAEPERVLSADERRALYELVTRRAAYEPVAYLVGTKAFHDIEVGVNEDTLIPRPETETLVEVALEKLDILATGRRPERQAIEPETLDVEAELDGEMPWDGLGDADRVAPLRVLDVGTGSGAVALAIAHARADVVAVGVDVQARALEQARLNAERLGLASRCRFLASDLFADVPLGSLFDLVVSNPPYVADHELATTPPDVHAYEPATALLGGPDGLDFYRRIVPAAPPFLAPRGFLALEIAEGRAAQVVDIFRAAGRYEAIEVRDDLGGRPRVVAGRERA